MPFKAFGIAGDGSLWHLDDLNFDINYPTESHGLSQKDTEYTIILENQKLSTIFGYVHYKGQIDGYYTWSNKRGDLQVTKEQVCFCAIQNMAPVLDR